MTSKAHALLARIQEADNEDESDTQTNVFESVGGDAHPEQGDSTFSVEGTDTDRLFAGATAIDELLDGDNETASTESVESRSEEEDEMLPLTTQQQQQTKSERGYGSTHPSSAFNVSMKNRRKKLSKCKRFMKQSMGLLLNPLALCRWVYHVARQSYTLTVGFYFFVASWVLFYYMGNPLIEFLPGHASLAWWLNFVGRLLITLDLARLSQWVLIDNVVLGTRFAVHCLGPLVTLYVIQSKGWPFISFAWGLINMFLLHGDRPFTQHWLSSVTSLRIYNEANSGTYILESPAFCRILLSMMLAGVMTAGKRTVVAMFFGRRTFTAFKPRLEKILREVVLLSEVAELAVEVDRADEEQWHRKQQVQLFTEVNWRTSSSLQNKADDSSDDEEESEATYREEDVDEGMLETNLSGSLRVKDLLDFWEEPENKLDKSMNASIHDILQFRRALEFMDEDFAFGQAFGPARNREEVIKSSHLVYYQLLKMTPDRKMLSCDILSMLAENEDGVVVDPAKRKALRKLFRPDANNGISLLAFIQSCDNLYKKLRFFRASVGNASVIDHALEKIIDAVYLFVLTLTILAVMRINAWQLLVSISTLLVSVSFAVSSSASRYIEGLLLIAVRRPYDLGDRIFMMDPSEIKNDPGLFMSWFVEGKPRPGVSKRFESGWSALQSCHPASNDLLLSYIDRH